MHVLLNANDTPGDESYYTELVSEATTQQEG